MKRESWREEIDRTISRNLGDGERDVSRRSVTCRYLDDYENEDNVRDAILVTGTTIRMKPIVLVVLRMVTIIGRTLVSIMIVVVVTVMR